MIYMYVYFYLPLCKRKQEVTEVHYQVGMRAEVEYEALDTYGGGNSYKEGAARTLP